MARVRIRFSKLGKIRWTSHRDLARMWERAFRREQLPLLYTSGFSPRPKVSFGLALPTGHESVAEYLDLEVADDGLDLPRWPAALSAALPSGVDADAVAIIDAVTPSLQEAVTSCTWRLAAVPADAQAAPSGFGGQIADRAASVLASEEVVVTRSRKGAEVTDDIRSSILDLRVIGPVGPLGTDGVWLEAELAAQPRSLRPSELLAALSTDVEERHVRRLHQWISRDGARREPLEVPAGATDAPHALERAS